jgi:hypothetical protein
MGNFISSSCDSADLSEYENQTVAFRKVVSKVSETISVAFVPGTNDVGINPTLLTIENYRRCERLLPINSFSYLFLTYLFLTFSRYGADYYGFWYGGMRGLVINSPLLVNPQVFTGYCVNTTSDDI